MHKSSEVLDIWKFWFITLSIFKTLDSEINFASNKIFKKWACECVKIEASQIISCWRRPSSMLNDIIATVYYVILLLITYFILLLQATTVFYHPPLIKISSYFVILANRIKRTVHTLAVYTSYNIYAVDYLNVITESF